MVPTTDTYQILASGAQGGNLTSGGTGGGLGAEIGGDFSLAAGEILQIAVGGLGMPGAEADGGGGSFVVGPGNTPLVIAGGGSGQITFMQPSPIPLLGRGGLTGPDGGGNNGGTAGNGAMAASAQAAAGVAAFSAPAAPLWAATPSAAVHSRVSLGASAPPAAPSAAVAPVRRGSPGAAATAAAVAWAVPRAVVLIPVPVVVRSMPVSSRC
jgi:hypothetical protein